ncbi:MAG: DUF1801 domain-containing protein [Gammaproteobacteria bacterium]
MAENKTVATNASVGDFTKGIKDAQKRADCKAIMTMMRAATGKRAKMWGATIVGFGSYDYHYESGRTGSAVLTGLSPRAQNIAIYIMPGFDKYAALLKKLGKHKIGKSCLYIKRLSDVDEGVLNTLIERSVADMNKKYNKG